MLEPNTAIRKQKNGEYEYVYLDKNKYSGKTKRSEHKRKYLGKLVDGYFIPNTRYQMELEEKEDKAIPPREEVEKIFPFKVNVPEIVHYRILKYGAVWLLEQIARVSGLRDVLIEVFGQLADTILHIAYYLVLSPKNPAYLIEDWAREHLIEKMVDPRRISELCQMLTREKEMEFYKLWMRTMDEDETLLYDTTTISTYSKGIEEAEIGKSKQGENIPQINVAMLVGQKSRLPYYGRILDGNIADVSTLLTLINEIAFLELEHFKGVFDRGFCSQANVEEMLKLNIPFLMGLSRNWKMVEDCRPENKDEFLSEKNYDPNLDVYICSDRIPWKNTRYKIFVHTYFSYDLERGQWDAFHASLYRWKEELVTKKKRPEHQSYYKKYFIKGKDDGKNTEWIFNQKNIDLKKKECGWFTLISSYEADGSRALETYRTRNLIEERFGDFKNVLNFRRMHIQSSLTMEGKFLIELVALVLESWIKREMDEHNLFAKYTMPELLIKLGRIKLYLHKKGGGYFTEITKKWKEIYEDMGVPVPTQEAIFNEFLRAKN